VGIFLLIEELGDWLRGGNDCFEHCFWWSCEGGSVLNLGRDLLCYMG